MGRSSSKPPVSDEDIADLLAGQTEDSSHELGGAIPDEVQLCFGEDSDPSSLFGLET